jgi:hypothetical protein
MFSALARVTRGAGRPAGHGAGGRSRWALPSRRSFVDSSRWLPVVEPLGLGEVEQFRGGTCRWCPRSRRGRPGNSSTAPFAGVLGRRGGGAGAWGELDRGGRSRSGGPGRTVMEGRVSGRAGRAGRRGDEVGAGDHGVEQDGTEGLQWRAVRPAGTPSVVDAAVAVRRCHRAARQLCGAGGQSFGRRAQACYLGV